MKINKQAKEEIRKVIEEQLQSVPLGERIRLDNELLDELLFEKVLINEEKGIVAKIPIWYGEFLRKIDLSHISFKNAVFGSLRAPFKKLMDEGVYEYICEIIFGPNGDWDCETKIDYSYTNANIDLSNLLCSNLLGSLYLTGCNFKGLDFSNQNLNNIQNIVMFYSDVSDTGWVIPQHVSLECHDCNLSNIDLSNRVINGNLYFNEKDEHLCYCCLANTGININFSESEYIRQIQNPKYGQQIKELYSDTISKDWVGCFVNGEMIKNSKENDRIKEDLISSVVGSIEEQISGFKSK